MKKTSRKFTGILISLLALIALVTAVMIPVLVSASETSSNVVYYAACDSGLVSIEEGLDAIGVDSSKANRTLIAAANGIDDYTGTVVQDELLLSLLKNGMLVKAMPDPVDTTAPTTESTTAATTEATETTEPERETEFHGTYGTVAMIYDQGTCPSMQGLAVGSQYLYCVKINSTDDKAFITMVDKDTGDKTVMTNAATGTSYFYNLGHANDMDVWGIDGSSQLFVTTTNKGTSSILRFKRSGSTLTQVGNYRLTYNGNDIAATAIAIKNVSGGYVNFIMKNGRTVYSGAISTSATSGTVAVTKAFSFDVSQAYVRGTQVDLSSWVNQGFAYHDGKMFVPLSGDSDELNRSVILVYDIVGASGTIQPDKYLSFRVTSSAYSALFEIEACGICSADGKLYFCTNRRVTDSDTNYDGIHYFDDYVYYDF